VPIVACLAETRGAKFVTLLNRLGLPRDSLTRTLHYGIAAGWIMRNPGYGHPLRPEYLLTTEGERISIACQAVLATQSALLLAPDALNRWSLPIIRLLADGVHRFNDLSRGMPAASPRALTLNLKMMLSHRLIDRQLTNRFPPGADYVLTGRGQQLAHAAEQ
jgi:DNA-binding HxlR family transcriptional regulator